ncbi:MAG: beta-N-acetylhexosaminidase [Proteobacteria bacterium]|nr:beta-N-acetylhexosaminidase [Pseudomonadota bacterium]
MTTVGRMLMVGLEGKKVTSEHRLFLKETGAGGVILFERNCESPKQIARFIADLRDAATGPLIVGVDQEGGRVARLSAPFTSLPPMAALGRAGDAGPGLAKELGAMLGRELAAVGVDVDFAPVADVATNPANPVIGDRAISKDADIVGELCAAFIEGMQSEGVAACAKHFPGHGDTDVDSHMGLPLIPSTRGRFDACEFVPFKRAIEAGVGSVMIGHILTPNLDPTEPASVSAPIITRILRGEMGFSGLVITDDLVMKGISDRYTSYEAGWKAIAAGADMVMVCSRPDEQRAALEGMRRAVGEGWIGMQTVARALERIEAFKQRFPRPDKPPSMRKIGCRSHRKLASRLFASL